MSPTRRLSLALLGGLAIVAVAVVAYLVLFRGTAADEVSLDTAAEAAASPSASTTTDAVVDDLTATETPSSSQTGLDGTWAVVPGEAATVDDGTFVGYRVQEELAGVGSTTATGRTPAVEGSMTIEDATVTAVDIDADLTRLQSDAAFRDRALSREGLELDQFPTATFRLTEPIELPDDAAAGEPVEVDAVGEFTLHGVTRSVTWPLQAQLVDETIVVVGSLDIQMAEYDITPPSARRVLAIDDAGVAELQLRVTQQ